MKYKIEKVLFGKQLNPAWDYKDIRTTPELIEKLNDLFQFELEKFAYELKLSKWYLDKEEERLGKKIGSYDLDRGMVMGYNLAVEDLQKQIYKAFKKREKGGCE